MDGGGDGRTSGKMKKAMRKLFVWSSFCLRHQQSMVIDNCATVSPKSSSEITARGVSNSISSTDKNLCTICLDPLNHSSGPSPSQPVFTAQCSHSFHFACISSSICHGSISCPICRAQWTQLPCNLNSHSSLHNKLDPALQMLINSTANLNVHRNANLLPPVRYNDGHPNVPDRACEQSRLHLSLYQNFNSREVLRDHLTGSSSVEPRGSETAFMCCNGYLHVKLSHQPPMDLVLVASTNGPYLRMMKQAMALTVFSLRPTDRLAIITYSSGAARVLPLMRMTSYGKRAALQAVDHLFYTCQADSTEGLRKGVEILESRLHKNQYSCILQLANAPSRSFHWVDLDEFPVPIHRFNMRYEFNSTDGFFRQEFEEFLAGTLGGGVEDVQLRIGEGGMVMSIGKLRGGEERKIPVCVGESGWLCVSYRYRDGKSIRRGEIVAGIEVKGEASEYRDEGMTGGRISSGENWSYHDPAMARRWAKHLHGYRLYT